ncbi:MAG: todS 4 [Bacteroidetes bacterium]|nr:todS 4 [Bacteroidota bacterium]
MKTQQTRSQKIFKYIHPRDLILLVLMFSCSIYQAEGQGSRLYTSADGLPSTKLLFMSQDKDGYVWMCNYGGLAKFDGYGITAYYESRGIGKLRSSSVYRFLPDELGQCWVGTERGLHLFHPKTERFEHIQLDKSEDNNVSREGKSIAVLDMAFLHGGKKLLVCAGAYGFFIIDIRTHKIIKEETARIRAALEGIVCGHIFIDSRQRLWIFSGEMIVFDLKTFSRWKPNYAKGSKIKPFGMEILDFIEDKATRSLLVADGWNGVLIFDERSKQFRKLEERLTLYQKPQCFLQRKDGTLLVGCENNGIGQIDISKRTITEYAIRDCQIDLKYSKIHDIIEDRWGNLYVGIYQKGLLVVPASTGGFSYQAIGESHPVQNRAAITSFAHTANGKFYIGTDGGGVFAGSDFNNMRRLESPAKFTGAVQDMAVGPDASVWLGTYGNGLFHYDGKLLKAIEDNNNVTNKNISCLQLDKSGKRLYIGNIGTGASQLDLVSGKMSKIQGSVPKYIFALKLDSKGRLWIGSQDCLCYDPNSKKICNLSLGKLKNSTISSFFEHDDGSMYIGTKNGLFIYDEVTDSCRHYPLDNTGSPVHVMAIAADFDRNVWMSTNRGIILFYPRTGNTRRFSWYDIQKVGDFHNGAQIAREDGTIVFGGDNGVISFNPSSIQKQKDEFIPIHFSSLYINGEMETFDINSKFNRLNAAIGYASLLTLPHYENSFAIRFSPFNYAVSSQLRYMYQLEGYESKWHTTTADAPQAVYNQLPPGKYKLIVKSFKHEKGARTSVITMDIVIQAPWYWSPFTKSLYFLILVIIFYFQYRGYIAREKSKKRLRTVMAEYLRIKENYQNLIQAKDTTSNSIASTGNTMNDKLKEKIMSTISKHFSDPKFGVEELSRETGMSRVHLYRRTKELYNCSPNDLLRSVRMKKAGLMLIQEKASIGDVAFEAGFSDPSYFSTAFKRYFNISPKDFVARYRNNQVEDTIKQLFEL